MEAGGKTERMHAQGIKMKTAEGSLSHITETEAERRGARQLLLDVGSVNRVA